MEKTNSTFVSAFTWLKALALLLVFGFAGAQQAYAQPPQLVVFDAGGLPPVSPMTKVLPEGQCGYQFQWTVNVFDLAGPATATAYINTTTVSTSVNPGATLMQLGAGQTYVLDVIAAVGTNTLTIRKDGPSGSVTQTYIIIVDDVRAPQIYGPGNMTVEVPSCDVDGIPVNWTISTVDDCDLAPILRHTGGPASGSVLSPAGSPYTVSYSSTDDDGNVATYSFTVTVNQSPDPDPIIDVSGNGQFSVPACQPGASVIFTGNVIDCGISANSNLAGQITVSGAPLTVSYIQVENGFAFFEATGSLAPGIYPINVSYGGVTVQTLFTVVQDANQLPDIHMPGNLTFLLPACTNQISGRFAITITDDCDPVISTSPSRLSFTYRRTGAATASPLTWTAGSDLAQGYFEFERALTAADNGAVITASYRDGANNLRVVNATLSVVSQPDTWAPLIIYPSQDINVALDPCESDPAVVFFEVTVTDNCDGDYTFAPDVVPGSNYTVDVFLVSQNGGGSGAVSPVLIGGQTFLLLLDPGVYQVVISAEDAAGNDRQEDFFVVVTQAAPPPTNLACNVDMNITVDGNCQRFITADMVLEGSFGCAQESDFRVNIVNDDDPTNGNILDGCGRFIYEVTYVGPDLNGPAQGGSGGPGTVVNGFNGAFAPANWTITYPPSVGTGGSAGPGTVNFTATSLLIESGDDAGAIVSIPMPANGQLRFDYSFRHEDDIQDDMLLIDLNGNVILDLMGTAADQVVTGSGSVNQPVQTGWVLLYAVRGDGFATGGVTSFIQVDNFAFTTSGVGGGGLFPFFNWQNCWGYITGEDKAAPALTCPANTSQGTIVESCYSTTGNLATSDLNMQPLNFSCFIDGQAGIDPGVHYYDLIPFQVDRTDYYTILVSDQFVTSTGAASAEESAIALFQGGFSPSNPCENIIAFQDEPIDNINPPLGNGDPYLRLTMPLVAGETYYLWITSDDALATGTYSIDICPDNTGRVGLFQQTTVLNPLTWEPMVVNNTQLWPTRNVTIPLPLFCEDFDLIYNNPASLAITGAPQASDNCDNSVTVTFVDTYTSAGDCAPIIIRRTFRAVDDKGNASTCTQTITLNRPDDLDVEFPPRTVPIECDEQFAILPNGNPHPSVSGYPFILTVSGIQNLSQAYCNIGASYVDRTRVNVCAGAFKFVRDWTVIDWCDGDNIATDQQVIKVGDFTAPAVTCPGPGPLVYSTSPFSCTAAFSVPLPVVTDNCSNYQVKSEIVTEVEVQVTNQYGIVTGTRTDTVVVRTVLWNAPSRLVSGIPAGNHYFRYTVNDDCGNQVVVYCPFTAKDQIEPTAICDDNLNISIGGGSFTYSGPLANVRSRVYATDINEGSNDNCAIDRIEVRRNKFNPVTYDCGTGFSNWGPYVDFFCCDVGVSITIEMRVIDKAGNINTCWLDIVPEEKVRPYCYAPAPRTIDCDDLPYSFNATDTLQLQALFGDATSDDNCGSYERELPPVPDLECGFGTIIRRFRAVDVNRNESVNFCQQVVTIREVHNYEIKFPKDAEAICGVVEPDSVIYEEIGCDLLAVNHTDEFFSASGNECYKIFRKWKVINWCQYDGQSDQPLVIGRDEDCDGAPGDEAVWVLHRPGGFNYIDRDDDETEPNNVPLAFQNICNGIDDFWRKVDYNGGYYQYTQIIKVYDNIDPEIIAAPQDFCSYDNVTCTGLVGLPFTIDENCTPNDLTIKVFLDAGANGSIDANLLNITDGLFDDFRLTGSYPNYQLNGRFPIGCHAFEVHVEDGCGNVNSELLDFCVVDCKAPAPVCINGLALELMPVDLNGDNVPDDGRMVIWASDFIVSPSSDCTGPIKYSINRTGDAPNVDSTGITLTCADTGTVVVEIWAYDGAGNSDFCETYVLVQDNMNLCGPSPLAVGAAGAIATEVNNAVEDVQVSLSGQASASMMTNSTGSYSFNNLQQGYDYTVTPRRNGDYLNGVSTFDLVLMSKHILGVQPLNSPYKMIAADVNNSKSITTLDLIQLRKLILSIDTQMSNNTSWRFVKRSYVFPRPNNPWFEAFPEVVNINNLPGTGISNADFVAIKVGDVNLDAQTNSLLGVQGRTMAGAFAFNVEDVEVKAGQEYTVAFTAADIASIEGYQATLVFNNSALELVDIVEGEVKKENFGLVYANEGLITTSWNQIANSEQRNANTVMFSLVFRSKADARLSGLLSVSSRITKAEAYRSNGDLLDVAIEFAGTTVAAANNFELYQNTPNPFKGETLIGFNLPADGKVTVTISDVTGKVLKLVRLDGVMGYNNVVVNSNDLPAAGVLYYTVETAGHTATKKMVIIE
ncbi:MAG: T9SS type A sorting domain-containing protein [Lewinellaceae bacterium]|nr:T9SS type A sorting domain-containing protein [Lewinellaceae bacterium]